MHIHRAASYVNAMWQLFLSLYANFHFLNVFLSPLFFSSLSLCSLFLPLCLPAPTSL